LESFSESVPEIHARWIPLTNSSDKRPDRHRCQTPPTVSPDKRPTVAADKCCRQSPL